MTNQKGFATLTVAVLLLLVVTLTVFMGVRGSIIEQQSANNAYLTQVAFEHAEQGRARFIANIKAQLTSSSTLSDDFLTPVRDTINNTSGGKYSVLYVISEDKKYATLTSNGTVVGNTSRKVSQRVSLTAGGSGPGGLTARGDIDLDANTKASSAKAGGKVTGEVGGIETTETSTNNPNATQYTNEFKVGPGPDMRIMTSDEFFMYYFGKFCPAAVAIGNAALCKVQARDTVMGYKDQNGKPKGYVCDLADCSKDTKNIDDAYEAGVRVFWLSNGGLNHNTSMGSEEDPVVIFVMNIQSGSDDGKINAGSNIYGVLYVDVVGDTPIQIGNWEAGGTGNLTTEGAVLTSGNYHGTGNATYNQNTEVVTKALADFGGGGLGFTYLNPAILSVSRNSWSDMN